MSLSISHLRSLWPFSNELDPIEYGNNLAFPKISIIIPNFNQGAYIEETILSVINQNYSNFELIIIDGGSSDQSLEIIKKYQNHIHYWISEKDTGQSDAINKGFKQAKGDYIAWMNSDDIYCENAFLYIFSTPNISSYDFIYGPVYIGMSSDQAKLLDSRELDRFTLNNLLKFFFSTDYIIPSQSVFVSRSFLNKTKIGYLDKNLHYCMDMEWYSRITLSEPKYYKYPQAMSFFRLHDISKTVSQYGNMQTEAKQILLDKRKHLSKQESKEIFRLLFLHKCLHGIFNNKIRLNLLGLLLIFMKAPIEAANDRRFLGLFKKLL